VNKKRYINLSETRKLIYSQYFRILTITNNEYTLFNSIKWEILAERFQLLLKIVKL